MSNADKIILDLCGGTGSWSKPYREAGYDVRVITLPEFDVLTFQPPENVHGILAAPPCNHFAVSGAQYWQEKDRLGHTEIGLAIAMSCLRIIRDSSPHWWALENPVGRLRSLLGNELGEPILIFNPCDYGDPWTKKTLLWGGV